MKKLLTSSLFLTTILIHGSFAIAQELSSELEQLINTPLTDIAELKGIKQSEDQKEEYSSSKNLTEAMKSPASIYVITSEDIKRSGAVAIPDVLRMVPGVQVAQTGASRWNITIRGFNGKFANKLLVLVDGRSVYSPIFGGVYWDEQDMILEDIARIEVIRGSGGTIWGDNAVNGVINIITKKAKTTQGTLITSTMGTNGTQILGTRYGGKTKNDVYYSAYAKYLSLGETFAELNKSNSQEISDDSAHDSSSTGRAGFKAEWTSSQDDSFFVSGNTYYGEEGLVNVKPIFMTQVGQTYIGTTKDVISTDQIKGGNITGRWEREVSSTSKYSLQAFYDYVSRNQFFTDVMTSTADVDFQHSFAVGGRNAVTWGLGYRNMNDKMFGIATLDPVSSDHSLYTAFLQDKIAIVPDKLDITIGSKFSHNEFTHFEYQPSARLAYYPTKNQTIWTAVSRAVKTPDRSTLELANSILTTAPHPTNSSLDLLLRYTGPRESKPESVLSYEAGYKIQLSSDLYFDTSFFYNTYRNGFTFVPVTTSVTNTTTDDILRAHVYGGDMNIKWQATENSDYELGYSLTRIETKGYLEIGSLNQSGTTPSGQLSFRANYNLPNNVQWTNSLYYVNNLDPLSHDRTDAYTRIDTRIAWQPIKQLELSIVGQNLFDDRHREFAPGLLQRPVEMGRTALANVKWSF